MHPARLRMMRIDVDDDQDDAGQVRRRLAVKDQILVVRGMKAQAVVVVERGILSTDLVDARDKFAEDVGPLPVPLTYLVLFRVEIFLALSGRPRFAVLKRRAVNAVGRS